MHRPYDEYEDLFDPMKNDRQARRKRKPKAHHKPKKKQDAIIEEIADTTGIEAGFQPTYQPSLYEAEWLLSSLETFYNQQIITDILYVVKGGKEASVYCCEAHPSTGLDLIAAKVYRPKMFRSLSNDQMYQEGREIMQDNGKTMKGVDYRMMRAVKKKSGFGEKVVHQSWLMYEFTTMQTLYRMEAAVPQPIAAGENAVLMEYIGAEGTPAPTLNSVRIDREEAQPLFDEVMRNVDLMLSLGMIHGDLSAYNILYLDGEVVLIDFPQVTKLHTNSSAAFILNRDITRICEYFSGFGVDCDPDIITRDLWMKYVPDRSEEIKADLSRWEE